MDTERWCDVMVLVFANLLLLVAFGAQGQQTPSPLTKGNATSRTPNSAASTSAQARQMGGFFPNPGGYEWPGDNPWIDSGTNVGASGVRFCHRRRGQFPHPLYCDRFYNCWDGSVYVQPCPAGLMFQSDPNRPYCDFPANVRCGTRRTQASPSNRMCPQSSGIFPHPTDCRLFVSCVGTKAFVQSCPRTLLFSAELKVCDYAHNVECRGRRPHVLPEVTEPDPWLQQGGIPWWPDESGSALPWPGQSSSGAWPPQPGSGVRPGQAFGSGNWPGLGPGVHPFAVYARNQKGNVEPRDDKNENKLSS